MKVDIGGISFDVTNGQNSRFWSKVVAGEWEPETFAVFRERLTRSTTVLDVGAWIGATALYAAHFARRVIAYEPDPIAFEELRQNLALNPSITNVTAVNAAIAATPGTVRLGIRDRAGDSTSSMLLANDGGGDGMYPPLPWGTH